MGGIFSSSTGFTGLGLESIVFRIPILPIRFTMKFVGSYIRSDSILNRSHPILPRNNFYRIAILTTLFESLATKPGPSYPNGIPKAGAGLVGMVESIGQDPFETVGSLGESKGRRGNTSGIDSQSNHLKQVSNSGRHHSLETCRPPTSDNRVKETWRIEQENNEMEVEGSLNQFAYPGGDNSPNPVLLDKDLQSRAIYETDVPLLP